MAASRRASADHARAGARVGGGAPGLALSGGARGSVWPGRPRGQWALASLAVAAVALAVASLSLPSTPSYDPWAWLVWGREITHGRLHTLGGPSWKPLPVLFTTIFAPFADAQPDLWLVVARAGAALAVALAFRLGWRLSRMLTPAWARTDPRASVRALRAVAPLLAGAIAAGSLLNSPAFISDNALGYSEGLASALLLGALDQILDRRPRAAFVLGFFAALDRPELWFFWVPYGVLLMWRQRDARTLVLAAFGLVLLLWFVPELWGSGHLLRSVTRALRPGPNSAAFSSCPVCAEFRQVAWPQLLLRVKVPAIAAGLAALWGAWRARPSRRERDPDHRQLHGGGAAADGVRPRVLLAALVCLGYLWWFGIAVETQAGFSGNVRYLVLGTAPLAVAGGVAWGWFALAAGDAVERLAAHGRWSRAALAAGAGLAIGLFLATPPWLGRNIVSLPQTRAALAYQAHLRIDLAALVRRFGRRRLLGCGNGAVMTGSLQVPMVAWYLRVRTLRIQQQPPATRAPAPWPSVILQARAVPAAPLEPAPATIRHWRSLGARYERVERRTFTLLLDCRK